MQCFYLKVSYSKSAELGKSIDYFSLFQCTFYYIYSDDLLLRNKCKRVRIFSGLIWIFLMNWIGMHSNINTRTLYIYRSLNSVDALSLLLLLLLVVTIAAAFERLHQHCFNSNFESMAQKQIVQFRKKLTNYLCSFSVAFSWLQLIRFVAYCRRIISLFIFHSVKCLDFNAVCSCCNFYSFFFAFVIVRGHRFH